MLKRSLILLMTIVVTTAIGLGYKKPAKSAAVADPVYGSGTPKTVARWTDPGMIGDSSITDDGAGHVGIGGPPNSNFNVLVSSNVNSPFVSLGGYTYGTGRGIEGSSSGGIGINGIGLTGVNGITFSSNPNDAAVRGISTYGIARAGDFFGNVRVTGMLTKGGGSFRIDHPLDPKNKYLSHSFVESPDMMNIYNGNIVTNSKGEAVVTMPDYFGALNRDFRYQLTVIGQFAQAMVMQKLNGNSFRIKTDKPGVEVSWQVTGIRKDKFAEENRIQVESDKPVGERGTLQNP